MVAQLFPPLYALIFGAIAALGVWSVDQKRLNKFAAWAVIVTAGMFFRIAGQL
jgi:hypothetical protein